MTTRVKKKALRGLDCKVYRRTSVERKRKKVDVFISLLSGLAATDLGTLMYVGKGFGERLK